MPAEFSLPFGKPGLGNRTKKGLSGFSLICEFCAFIYYQALQRVQVLVDRKVAYGRDHGSGR